MKTTKLLVLALLLALGFTASTNAQFYVKVGAGFGFLPIAGQQFDESPSLADTTNDLKFISHGMGIQPFLGFGYHVTKNIALELTGMYLLGTKHEQTATNFTSKHYGEGIFIVPAFRVQAPLKSITPFTRIGLIIGIPKVKVEDEITGEGAYTYKYEYTGGLSLGMEGALGMDIKASKMMNVFIELNGMALNYLPDERVETENTIAGSTLNTTTYSRNEGPYETFGNFGARVGVSFLFGKMPKK